MTRRRPARLAHMGNSPPRRAPRGKGPTRPGSTRKRSTPKHPPAASFGRGAIARWLAVAAATAAALCAWLYLGPGPRALHGVATDLVLAPGLRLPMIAQNLRRAGVVRFAPAFIAAAELTGSARGLKAGEYNFASGASLAEVLDALRRGAVVQRVVTVPEGVTSTVVAAILSRAPFLSGEAVSPAEGAVLPETYEVRRGEDRSEVIGRMVRARETLLNTLWAARAPDLPYRDPSEAVILASIVEKETALASERPHVAAVFVNRLRAGMPLESDPTVIYGLTGGAALGHGLTRAELKTPSPYNTYLAAGLPPTPIGNPGRASLAAALSPTPSRDLFSVAYVTCGYVFTSDYAAHLRNVARWRDIERARAAGATS